MDYLTVLVTTTEYKDEKDMVLTLKEFPVGGREESGGSDFIRDKCPLDIPLGDRVQVPDRLIRAPRGWG